MWKTKGGQSGGHVKAHYLTDVWFVSKSFESNSALYQRFSRHIQHVAPHFPCSSCRVEQMGQYADDTNTLLQENVVFDLNFTCAKKRIFRCCPDSWRYSLLFFSDSPHTYSKNLCQYLRASCTTYILKQQGRFWIVRKVWVIVLCKDVSHLVWMMQCAGWWGADKASNGYWTHHPLCMMDGSAIKRFATSGPAIVLPIMFYFTNVCNMEY